MSLRVRLDHRVWGKCRKGKNIGNFHSFDLGAWGMSIIVEKVDYCADEVLISSLASWVLMTWQMIKEFSYKNNMTENLKIKDTLLLKLWRCYIFRIDYLH